MDEETEEKKPDLVKRISKFLPAVGKPEYKQGLNTRLKWTGIALLCYFVLSYISVYGLSPSSYQQFQLFQIVLGSKMGSLMTLGIGPIVTAGIILQLLVGSKILKWDMTKPEGRSKFQLWDKVLAIAFCFLEGGAYVLAGALPVSGGPPVMIFVILQLAAGGIIVILLDELVSKWGFGSGVSLFIAAGVASQIFIGLFSPLAAQGRIAGAIPGFISSFFAGNMSAGLAYLLPVLTTALVFIIVIYAQGVGIDIPLTFSAMRGFGRTWSLKFFYTSNIPVILVAALIANVQLVGHFGVSQTAEGLSCGMMGCFDANGNAVKGIVFYLSSPHNLLTRWTTSCEKYTTSTNCDANSNCDWYPEDNSCKKTPLSSEILRASTYTAFLAIGAMVFSLFWVNTSGMDAKAVANQLYGTGMQIPGYRNDVRIMESVLKRYIPALTILGGLSIGLLAAFADMTGAIGSGTGILLTVMILYNFYEQLRHEKIEEAHPIIRKIIGE
jgi:preprotein translocase subunit SecY